MLSVALGRATSRALLNCTRYALLAGHGDKGGACRSILVKEPKLSSWPDSRADPASHDGRIEITAQPDAATLLTVDRSCLRIYCTCRPGRLGFALELRTALAGRRSSTCLA